jgi:hypothetical protein
MTHVLQHFSLVTFFCKPQGDDKQKEKQLYPVAAYPACPHNGCLHFGFLSQADAEQHEMILHEAERTQRLKDRRSFERGEAVQARPFKCGKCNAAFSSKAMLDTHRAAREHQSKRQANRKKNKEGRKGKAVPDKPKPKRMPGVKKARVEKKKVIVEEVCVFALSRSRPTSAF